MDFIALGKEFGLPVLQLAVIYYFIDRRIWPVFVSFVDKMTAVAEKQLTQSLTLNTSWLSALSDVKESIVQMSTKFDLVVRAIDDKISHATVQVPFSDEKNPRRRRSDK